MSSDGTFQRDCPYRLQGTTIVIDQSAKTYDSQRSCYCRLNAAEFWEEVLPADCNQCPVGAVGRVPEHVTVYIHRPGPGVTPICICGRRLARDLSCPACKAGK